MSRILVIFHACAPTCCVRCWATRDRVRPSVRGLRGRTAQSSVGRAWDVRSRRGPCPFDDEWRGVLPDVRPPGDRRGQVQGPRCWWFDRAVAHLVHWRARLADARRPGQAGRAVGRYRRSTRPRCDDRGAAVRTGHAGRRGLRAVRRCPASGSSQSRSNRVSLRSGKPLSTPAVHR
jgi:hypothetical protein